MTFHLLYCLQDFDLLLLFIINTESLEKMMKKPLIVKIDILS